jgi:hypothetical protein
VKEFLSQARVAFDVKLVDEDDAAYDELLALGYRSVPVTVFGGGDAPVVVRGFDVAGLTTALRGAG